MPVYCVVCTLCEYEHAYSAYCMDMSVYAYV